MASTSGITFSGLASGLDTASIIKQLVQVESLPITRMQNQQSDLDAKSKKLTTLQSKLDDLRNASLALDTRTEALPTKASSSNSSVFSATATGGASLGTYRVHVDRLASAARVYSNAFTDPEASGVFGTGTLTLTVGTSSYDVDVTSTDTLDSVMTKINASGAPLTAGMLYDGSGWRLAVSGQGTGSANALTISEGGLTLGLSSPANVAAEAQDAQFQIDGHTLTRSTNVVADAIKGVTIELTGASAGATEDRITIASDPTALEGAVQKLVDAYNAVNAFVASEESWTGSAKDPTSLNGDATLRSVQARLRSAFLSPVVGTSGKYTTLASLGISTQKDGSLTLDKAKLTTALGNAPDAVAAVLGRDGTGAMTMIAQAADVFTSSSTGEITQRLTSMSKQRRQIDDRIAQMQARIDQYQTLLTSQFATLETTMSALKSQGDQITAALDALSASSSSKK